MRFLSKKLIIGLVLILSIIYLAQLKYKTKIDFNTQVKPLLNKKCIVCHGGVKKDGGFSILTQEEALGATQSGKPAIIPNDPEGSEFIKRLTHSDPEERMPYHEEPLNKDEIAILKQWVKEGAAWGTHWAYQPLKEIEIPKSRWLWGLLPAPRPDWVKNDIDYFILDKLKKENLTPSVEADKKTLLRRVSLDLTGLPASENLKNQFLNDNSPKAYENLVDSLLANPHYGERWAAMWLDLARYADTKGYERDDKRPIWRYRDGVIKAFNDDKPYNLFLTEQIAGDLLPNATDEQLIATAYHRNTMTNDEGGTDNEEFRTSAVIDRVNTTWETLMGTTFSCVQCHGHPYDPFKHEEYYKFMAFFNNTRDEDTYADYPLLREYKKRDSTQFLDLQNWFKNHLPDRWQDVGLFLKTLQPSINSLTADDFNNSELADTKWLVLRKNGSARLKNVNFDGKNQLIFPYNTNVPKGTLTLSIDSVKGPVIAVLNIDTSSKKKFIDIDLPPSLSGTHHLYFQYSNPKMVSFNDNGISFDWFHLTKKWAERSTDSTAAIQKFWNLVKSSEYKTTPIMQENPAYMSRKTHVFERGNWLVKGKEVQADIPSSLNPMPKNAPKNRLGLAQWLTDKRNPLVARTYINRLWEQLFGQGIVETLEDMGSQGIPPTHQELLDFLAYNFIGEDYQWSTKKMLKTIVMSATYRQDSKVTEEHLKKDPNNKLYARAPRVRLSAEQVRDQALAVSGLLSLKMYGESVFPYQPEGIWSSPWNGATWKQDSTENQYRRALYTYWKRSSPYPSMLTFDGVNREVCVSRRIRTNTPLQALVTLNDSTYVIAAVSLAQKMALNENNISKQIEKGFEIAVGQAISTEKRQVLEKLYETAFSSFSKKLTSNKTNSPPSVLTKEPPNIAALAVVANAILNLDEFLNK